MTPTEVEKKLQEYMQFGAKDLLEYAEAYLDGLKDSPSTLQYKKAKGVHEASLVLHDSTKTLSRDYRKLYEHILTPRVHKAIALLRRERESLKGLASAQALYREINQILPVFYSLHNTERARRRVLLGDLFSS